MKKLAAYLLVLFASTFLYAQNTTTVTVTALTDSDAAVWGNAQWTLTIHNPSGTIPTFTNTGQPIIPTFTGYLSGAGSMSQAGVANVLNIQPSNLTWTLQLKATTSTPSNTGAVQNVTNIQVSGGSIDITAVIESQILAPRFVCDKTCFGYTTTESTGIIGNSANFWLTGATPACKQFIATTWQSCPTGGTTIPASTAPSQLVLLPTAGSTSPIVTSTVPNMEFINNNNADYGILAFRAKLRSIQTGNTSLTLNGVIIGDSMYGGQGITVQSNMSINQLRYSLQQYGAGNQVSGLVPLGENNGLAVTPFSWSISGSGWGSVNDFGPYQGNGSLGTGAFNSMFTDTVTTDAATLVGECGNFVTIYGEENSTSMGWVVTIDGGAVANALTAQPGTPTMASSTYGLSGNNAQGCHTVVLKPVGGGTSYLYGASITNHGLGSQILLHNLAHGFARTDAWAVSPVTTLAALSVTGVPDFAVIELGTNDIINGGSGDTLANFTTNIITLITYLQSLNSNVAILLVQAHNVSSTPLLFTQAQAQASLQSLAATYNVAFLSYADSEGTEATANALGLMFSDGIHPSNNGGNLEGSLLAQKFLGVSLTPNGGPLGIGVDFFPSNYAPVGTAANQFNVGFLWGKGSGLSSGTVLEGFDSSHYYITDFMPNGSVYKGWKKCTYANGTALVAPSGETFCNYFPIPTANKQISTSVWLNGQSGTITGTALANTCDSGTVSITPLTLPNGTVVNAQVDDVVTVTPNNGVDVGGSFYLRASVTSTNTVTVYVCGTGTPASTTYWVNVLVQ